MESRKFSACILLDVEQCSSHEAALHGFCLKWCKLLSSSLKDAFSKCPLFPGKLFGLSSEEEGEAVVGFDEEDEVFVSAIISKYMESKCKRKSAIGIDTFRWALSPEHFLLAHKATLKPGSSGESREECSSAATRLSRCSSATSYDAFFSVKTRFSRSSSLNKIDFQDFSKRSALILELLHCEGWPFGLCKKAFLLPPLPKSPPDSWSWRKSGGMAKIHL